MITDYSDYDLQPIILAANKSTIDKNKDGVVAFMRGWLAAVKVYQEKRDVATAIVLKHFKDQGFSVDDKVVKLMLSKIDVNPEFGPQLKSYLTEEAQTLLARRRSTRSRTGTRGSTAASCRRRAPKPDRRVRSVGTEQSLFPLIPAKAESCSSALGPLSRGQRLRIDPVDWIKP